MNASPSVGLLEHEGLRVRVISLVTGDVAASGIVERGATSQLPDVDGDRAVVRILDASGIVVLLFNARSGQELTDIALSPLGGKPDPDQLVGGSALAEPRLALEKSLAEWRSRWCRMHDANRRQVAEEAFDRAAIPARSIARLLDLAALVLRGAPSSETRFHEALLSLQHAQSSTIPLLRALELLGNPGYLELAAACVIYGSTTAQRRLLRAGLHAVVCSLASLARIEGMLGLPRLAARHHAALFLDEEPPKLTPLWGGAFGWPPDEEDDDDLPEEPEDPPQFGGYLQRIIEIQQTAGPYEMTSMDPLSACAGDVITITGTGFDPGVEAVVFSGALLSIPVPPLSSTPTSVTVEVPAGAISGPVRLQVPAGALDPTLSNSLVLMKTGNAIELAIGSPVFVSLTVNGVKPAGPVCVPFGTEIELAWEVSPPAATVELQWFRWGLEVGLPAIGSYLLPADTPSVEITANATCGGAAQTIVFRAEDPPATLSVATVELTQGIQAFNRGFPADNSVPMLQGRDTVVRVYLDAGLTSDSIRVTGRATLDDGTVLLSDPANVWVGRHTPADRDSQSQTLNFMIPAAEAIGVRTLNVEYTSLAECGPVPDLQHVVWVPFAPSVAVPITLVLIRDLSGAMPSVQDAMSTLEEAVRLLPMRYDQISAFALVVDVATAMFDPGVPPWLKPLLATGYANEPGMWAHAQLVSRARSFWAGLNGIFVGVTSGWTRGMMAWPDTLSCITNLDVARMAHEIAHCFGLGHVITGAGESCDNGITVRCETLPNNGQLLDVPFDVDQMSTISGPVWDLMSYRNTRWPSPEHWVQLYEWSFRWT